MKSFRAPYPSPRRWRILRTALLGLCLCATALPASAQRLRIVPNPEPAAPSNAPVAPEPEPPPAPPVETPKPEPAPAPEPTPPPKPKQLTPEAQFAVAVTNRPAKPKPVAPPKPVTTVKPLPVLPGEPGKIIAAVRGWYNAGLLLDLKEMAHLSDSQHAARLTLSNPREQEMMRLRELPEYQKLAEELQSKFQIFTTFGVPRIDKDGIHASVSFRFNPEGAKEWVELKETASSFITQAYRARQQNLPTPTIEEVRANLLAPGSNLAGSMEAQANSIRRQSGDQPMRLVKEADGWKVDVTRMKTEPPPEPSVPRLSPRPTGAPTVP